MLRNNNSFIREELEAAKASLDEGVQQARQQSQELHADIDALLVVKKRLMLEVQGVTASGSGFKREPGSLPASVKLEQRARG